ncbi:predicted protein [Naegleria gruberi]|uniref:Predicted protein n=1 Tax=Naegleria gruberi TaxID=5762 RepID=D2VK22_NAEGR|nr:uncharacterized protein NAEGRDRAFT_50193 [Naegleria gruberi]EFC42875.1 predicted protein [Naegleria gruberi]|eukprot:XP_002675619.1 predicted protein [Naegleria gruberi strain NEG-M]
MTMESTIKKITEELNNIFKKIKSKYWTFDEEENEENRKRRRKQFLWMLIVGGGGLSAIVWYYIIRGRKVTTNPNKKSKSNYISDLVSRQVEKTKETVWMENLEPYLNDTTSYYQYLVKSKQASKDSIRFEPQWRISPSYTIETKPTNTKKKKSTASTTQSNGFVQYRTQSLTGREAGLPRIFSNEDDNTLTRFIPQPSSSNNWIFYLEKIRYIISLFFYRLPRAVAEWELWLGACSAAIYFVAMNQPFGFRQRSNQKDSTSKSNSIFMDGVMHRVVESSESNNNTSNSKVVKLIGEGNNVEVLEKSFDEVINGSSLGDK